MVVGDKIHYRSAITGHARTAIVTAEYPASESGQKRFLVQGNGWEDIVNPQFCTVDPPPFFKTPLPNKAWCDWAKDQWWYCENKIVPDGKDPRIFELRDRILNIAGDNVMLNGDVDDSRMLERGTWLPGDIGVLRLGEPNRCHANACAYHLKHPNAMVCTGYALSAGDGLWRSHSWCLEIRDNGRRVIIETTTKRLVYFGYVMTEAEAQEFHDRAAPWI